MNPDFTDLLYAFVAADVAVPGQGASARFRFIMARAEKAKELDV